MPKYQKAIRSLICLVPIVHDMMSFKKSKEIGYYDNPSFNGQVQVPRSFSLFGDNLVCLGAGSGREGQGKLTEWLQRW